jgi:hypothetical protein
VGGQGDAAPRLDSPRDVDIEFCGEVENPYPLIATMDVFTLPSRTDAFPLVVLEAPSASDFAPA